MTKPTPVHYVDNAKFLNDIIEYKKRCEIDAEAGKPQPKIPDAIAASIMKIANKLSFAPNFYPIAYREEMISDGIENCIRYFHNFDPQKSRNPFAYFTQIIYYAFLRRIDIEKEQDYVRHKSRRMRELDFVSLNEGEDLSEFDVSIPVESDRVDEFIRTFENSREQKRARSKAAHIRKGLEVFVDNEEETDK